MRKRTGPRALEGDAETADAAEQINEALRVDCRDRSRAAIFHAAPAPHVARRGHDLRAAGFAGGVCGR